MLLHLKNLLTAEELKSARALLGPEARDLLRRVLPPALVRRLPRTLQHAAEGRP